MIWYEWYGLGLIWSAHKKASESPQAIRVNLSFDWILCVCFAGCNNSCWIKTTRKLNCVHAAGVVWITCWLADCNTLHWLQKRCFVHFRISYSIDFANKLNYSTLNEIIVNLVVRTQCEQTKWLAFIFDFVCCLSKSFNVLRNNCWRENYLYSKSKNTIFYAVHWPYISVWWFISIHQDFW